MNNKLTKIQSGVLLAGALFAWLNVLKDFLRFYGFEGTIFKIKNCVIPNPVTEPCFYGAIAFLIAFIWSISLHRAEAKKQQRYLMYFLVAGTVFAWYNVTKEFISFYSHRTSLALGCSAIPITNPFLTACFYGASIFLMSSVIAYIINRKNHERV